MLKNSKNKTFHLTKRRLRHIWKLLSQLRSSQFWINYFKRPRQPKATKSFVASLENHDSLSVRTLPWIGHYCVKRQSRQIKSIAYMIFESLYYESIHLEFFGTFQQVARTLRFLAVSIFLGHPVYKFQQNPKVFYYMHNY